MTSLRWIISQVERNVSEAMRNCLLNCLHIDWHRACGWPWWEQHTASNGMSSLGGKRAVSVAPTGGRGHAINEGGETLSANKTNLLLVFAAWNHTLAKLVEEEPALLQLVCSLRLKLFSPLLFPFLCLCEVQLNTSLCPARSFTQSYCW